MKTKTKVTLFILAALYLLTRWARIHVDLPAFFRNHFTDLLFVPVQLITSLWLTRLVKRDPTIRISLVWIILQVVFVAFMFEWYMPNYGADREKFTGDILDVAMYALGGIAFVVFQFWETRTSRI